MSIYKKSLFFVLSFFIPVVVLAASEDAFDVLGRVFHDFGGIVALLIKVVAGMTLLAFFWGIFLYVFSQSTDGKVEGKKVMLYSLVAIFVMASLFGIVNLLQITFGVEGNPSGPGNFDVPKINNLPSAVDL